VLRDAGMIQLITGRLQVAYRSDPGVFDNAMLRDHIRCIGELADHLGVLPEGCGSDLTLEPIGSEWPLEMPTKDQAKTWARLLNFEPNEFASDFFKYSMNCLRPWEHAFPRESMAKWILQRAARDFRYEGSSCKAYDGYMLGKYGGGRSKPNWAERIGKKYLWVAMYQLASRLHDHVAREQDSWEPEPLRTPLILLEERKLDPTLPSTVIRSEPGAAAWWIAASADPGSSKPLTDQEWVARQDDVPTLHEFLQVVKHDGQNWRVLVSFPVWGQRDDDADQKEPYRQVWMHISSYLVQKSDIAVAFDSLHRRNFFGQWLPEGGTWLCGFAGEYPWATSFNTSPDESHNGGASGRGLRVALQPCWNRIAAEWEYDASMSQGRHMTVPSRAFFTPGDLWWDGKDGYRLVSGRSMFRDPSITEPGPASLLVDDDDLLTRLDKMGLRLVWTLLGEKWILGGPHDRSAPQRTFSQVAVLGEGGSLQLGERVFFEDYSQDAGPGD
jgi:hypothetical protein